MNKKEEGKYYAQWYVSSGTKCVSLHQNFIFEIMAIAIRPIPVLTGKAAERFEQMVEESKDLEDFFHNQDLLYAI